MNGPLAQLVESIQRGDATRAVFLGTSITFGSQVDPAHDPEVTYHHQWATAMARRFPGSRIDALNKGVPGNKIADGLARVERDAIRLRPDLVVVEFGINDCWDGPDNLPAFEEGLGLLAGRLKRETEADVVLLTANMLNHKTSDAARRLAWFADKTAAVQTSGYTDAYMEAVRRVARAQSLPLADGYARWQAARAAGTDTDTLLVNRANHPTREGHALLAAALIELFR